MKIAIAVEADNKTIAVRMGHAPSFAIFTLQDGQITEEGVFPNEHAGHHHHGEGQDHIQEHRRQLGELKNCDAVIVRGIGPSMKQALLEERVQIFRAKKSFGNSALELIQNFSKDFDSFKQEV